MNENNGMIMNVGDDKGKRKEDDDDDLTQLIMNNGKRQEVGQVRTNNFLLANFPS